MAPKTIEKPASYHGKRAIDIVVATLCLAVSSPALTVAACWIKCDSPGSVIFRQARVGYAGRQFHVYKLRTMTEGNNVVGQVVTGTPGVTRAGRMLRRLKLDEVPQLLNVLKGEMSLVGPRPCLPETLSIIDQVGAERFRALPGLTGLAQVNGNISLTWPERWRYDKEYVDHVSARLDLLILAKTVGVIFRGDKG